MLPPLDRLAALAQVYDVPLASLLVSQDALAPIVTLLERATAAQLGAIGQLLKRALDQDAEESA